MVTSIPNPPNSPRVSTCISRSPLNCSFHFKVALAAVFLNQLIDVIAALARAVVRSTRSTSSLPSMSLIVVAPREEMGESKRGSRPGHAGGSPPPDSLARPPFPRAIEPARRQRI